MRVKGWLSGAVVAALLGGLLLVGVTSLKASAAGNNPAGLAVQGIFHKEIAMRMVCGITEIADFLGISRGELTEALQSGKSIVQIAAEKGIGEQQLVDFMAEKYSCKIDQKVADGKITTDQADKLKQSMAERIKADLNRADIGPKGKMAPKDGLGMGMQMGRGMGDMEDLAEYIGISKEDLIAARQSGKSMVQIAGEKGIGEQQLVDYLMEKFNTKIDQKVTDGKITSEQAGQLKQSMAERIKARLNSTDSCRSKKTS